MKILLMNNDFSGAHGSFKTFFDEIKVALKNLGHEIFQADDFDGASAIYEQQKPDFSLGIGKYNFTVGKKILCDIYGRPHYQWILDNPLKMPRFSSENFTPIFIDREFSELYNPSPKTFLCLPLGIKLDENKFNCDNRLRGIVFAGQVKNLMALRDKISRSRQRALIEKFLSFATKRLDSSFIQQYKNFLAENIIVDAEEFFRLTNSYLRALKRVVILQKIRHCPLILAGNFAEKNLLQKPNVIYVGEVTYAELPELFSRYTHVLHISPNFSACIHDRIIRGLQAGNRVITEENLLLRQTFGTALTYFDYKNFDEKKLTELPTGNFSATNEILAQFAWEKILSAVIEDCRRRLATRGN